MTQNADTEAPLPAWLKAWRCPPCDDGIDDLPCECFDIMEATERYKASHNGSAGTVCDD